jgi:hypothetical protein
MKQAEVEEHEKAMELAAHPRSLEREFGNCRALLNCVFVNGVIEENIEGGHKAWQKCLLVL